MDQYDDNKSTRNYLAVKWDKLNTEKYKNKSASSLTRILKVND